MKGLLSWWLKEEAGWTLISIILAEGTALVLMLLGPIINNDFMILFGILLMFAPIFILIILPLMYEDYKRMKNRYEKSKRK